MFWTTFLLGNFLMSITKITGNLNVREKKSMTSGKNFESPVGHDNAVDPNEKRKARSSLRTRKLPRKTLHLGISFVYEVFTGGQWSLNKSTIRDASKIVTNVFKRFNVHISVKDVEELRPDKSFSRTKKPNEVLKRFLKYKLALINRGHRIDNTQLVVARTVGSGSELVAVTTYKTVCSKTSGGIIIERQKDTSHLALIMAHNLACSMGLISRKQFCNGGLKEKIISCQVVKYPRTTDEIRRCMLEKIHGDLKDYNLNELCEKNRARERIARKIQLTSDNEGESPRKLVVILVTATGGLIVTLLILGLYGWKKNRDKTKLLKDRVMVEYNYDAMTRRHTRPSVIDDSSVNVDLH